MNCLNGCIILLKLSVLCSALPLCAAGPCLHEPNSHAEQLYLQGNYAQAAEVSRRIVKELSVTGVSDCKLAVALTNLAATHQQLGEIIESDRELKKAARIWEQMGPEGEAGLLRVRNNLLSLYVENGLYTKANLLVPRIFAMPVAKLSRTPMDHAHMLNNLASACLATHKYRRARTLYEAALAIMDEPGVTAELEVAYVLNNFARLLIETREYSLAGRYTARAISILERRLGQEHPDLIKPLMNAAEVALLAGRTSEAEVSLGRAVYLSEKTLGSEHPQTGEALSVYGGVLRRLGRKEEARAARVKAEGILTIHRRNARALTNDIEANELAWRSP